MFKVFDNVTDPVDVNADEMMTRLAAKADIKLRQEALFANNGSTPNYRNAGLAAQMELDRRAQKRAEWLATKTTLISGGVGIVAALLGTAFGYWLNLPPAP